MASFPNLYADISSLTQANRLRSLPRLLRRREFYDRLLYGTDFPLITTGIVSPLFFLHRLSPRTIFTLVRIRNPWDRDVALKRALGMPAEVLSRAAGVLRSIS
jgi:hypothetical protein